VTTRSLRFRLIFWYAGWLTGCFGLLAVVTYVVLQNSLVASLKENQLRRARQVAQLLREESEGRNEQQVGVEVEKRYSPGSNDRMIRITRHDGVLLYLSQPGRNQTFDSATLPPPVWSTQQESARSVPLMGGRKLLLTAHKVQTANGQGYLVESGAPMDDVQSDLRKWLFFLFALFPVVALVALAGGAILVKRSLAPVDRITASAQRISFQNLTERLPIPPTGDELERLSVALNHMIERLDSAFQHSRRFVADASHELRTPLTVLKGEIEGFVREAQLPPDWRERLAATLEEVDRLANIVEGLFAISRLDAGEAAAEWVKFDLAQLASDTADQMSLLAEDKKIRLNCLASKAVWIEGDRARMKQVVVNLLDNAIKYTPNNGTITLSVRAEEPKAVLEVSDTGIGIPAAALPHVFERFYRVDKARSREQGGAGLGLSIVRSICTAHNGKVQASSTPGQGSRFRAELPLTVPPLNHLDEKGNPEHTYVRTS
jgi:heavy metal sensor kinase